MQRTSNSTTPINTWTHVAVTYDGAAVRHYINGVLDRTTAVSCAVTNTNSRPIRIGANGGGGEVMNGLIDEVRIYNRPLSAAEIQTDMGSSAGGGSLRGHDAPRRHYRSSEWRDGQRHGHCQAKATDNVAVAGVQFKVDGLNFGSEDISAPYSVAWNTTRLGERHSHTDCDGARCIRQDQDSGHGQRQHQHGWSAPTLDIAASPTSIASGDSSTLSWSSANATSCNASGAWSGAQGDERFAIDRSADQQPHLYVEFARVRRKHLASATVTVAAPTPAPT